LSPYLLILCAEGLSTFTMRVEATGDLSGVKICRNALIITHLLFAHDFFLFVRAEEVESKNMKRILTLYEAESEV
jgi:hypothetical protein